MGTQVQVKLGKQAAEERGRSSSPAWLLWYSVR